MVTRSQWWARCCSLIHGLHREPLTASNRAVGWNKHREVPACQLRRTAGTSRCLFQPTNDSDSTSSKLSRIRSSGTYPDMLADASYQELPNAHRSVDTLHSILCWNLTALPPSRIAGYSLTKDHAGGVLINTPAAAEKLLL